MYLGPTRLLLYSSGKDVMKNTISMYAKTRLDSKAYRLIIMSAVNKIPENRIIATRPVARRQRLS